MEILIGIICGIVLSLVFSLGPAFFSLIQNSIHHGFKKAVSFAAGVSLSDILIVMLMLTVLANLSFDDFTAILHNVYVAIIGSVATAVFAVLTWRSKVKKASDVKKTEFISSALYEYFASHPEELPKDMGHIIREEGPEAAAKDHVAGMTDRYAMRIYQENFFPEGLF